MAARALFSVLILALMATSSSGARPETLFEAHGDADKAFRELAVGEMTVFYHRRTIGEAVVEKDYVVYQLDARTGELLARKSHWRDDLPDALPPVISSDEAESLAPGEALFSTLYYISPESDVFPLDPVPESPCWVVRSRTSSGRQAVTIIDAVAGVVLGPGVPPPYGGFSLTGPWEDNPCEGGWVSWASNAETWFEAMGYQTNYFLWPTEDDVRTYVQTPAVSMFYELAHGGSQSFASGCTGGTSYEVTTASEIENWISNYGRMPFTFIGSCGGMCDTGDNSLSYEFRKGSTEGTTTVGYCGMAEPQCEDCWTVSIDWQNALFSYMDAGYAVKQAYDLANADVPLCPAGNCMRFAGDTTLAVVPVVEREGIEWRKVTGSPIEDPGRSSGLAWGDYDGDGDLDVYVSNWDGANTVYRNDGGAFVDATAAPLDDAGAGEGCAWADYDNDGDLDLYLANQGSANRLFRNDGGTFTDVATGALADSGTTNACSWADYDSDGYVDLFVGNVGANRLLRNDGPPSWSFTDVSSPPVDNAGACQCGAWADYDDDGDQDLYIVNRGSSNKLLRNDGGSFTDVTAGPVGNTTSGIGATWGDYDGDGDLDLYLTHLFHDSVLLRNDGGGIFTDVTAAPLDVGGHGTGTGWADYDNDGDLDLYVTRFDFANRLLRNDGAPLFGFTNATAPPLNDGGMGWGTAWGDYDGDGDLDLYVANPGANLLYENESTGENHWLKIDLTGSASNRSAIGARVRVVTGAVSQIREVTAGSGYLSQHSLTVEFGLASAVVVDTVEIRWPLGLVERAVDVPADQTIGVIEGTWTTGVQGSGFADSGVVLHGNYPNPFNPVTLLCYDLPRPTSVTLSVYSISGRLVSVLADGVRQESGRHAVPWDGRDDDGARVASGVYFYSLEAEGETVTKRMLLMK